jgi:hypothetical protein
MKSSVDPLILIGVAFFAVLIAEVVLSLRWNPTYFANGLPIFARRIERPAGLDGIDLESLMKSSATVAASAFAFRRLGDIIAFREKGFGGMLHYAPLMRGSIQHKSGEPQVVVKGLVNWTALAFIAAIVALLRGNVVVILPAMIGVLAVLYFIQAVRFARVAKSLRAAP